MLSKNVKFSKPCRIEKTWGTPCWEKMRVDERENRIDETINLLPSQFCLKTWGQWFYFSLEVRRVIPSLFVHRLPTYRGGRYQPWATSRTLSVLQAYMEKRYDPFINLPCISSQSLAIVLLMFTTVYPVKHMDN